MIGCCVAYDIRTNEIWMLIKNSSILFSCFPFCAGDLSSRFCLVSSIRWLRLRLVGWLDVGSDSLATSVGCDHFTTSVSVGSAHIHLIELKNSFDFIKSMNESDYMWNVFKHNQIKRTNYVYIIYTRANPNTPETKQSRRENIAQEWDGETEKKIMIN